MSDRKQPAAERPLRLVVIELADADMDRPQNILRQIGGVGVLQPLPSPKAVNQWRIEPDELPPRLAIARIAQADEQAQPSAWRVGHAISPTRYFQSGDQTYRAS